ncbi:hypothetical protein JYU34_011748 [Plutella xylostella]|uniref:FP protein C-terminal domain-containing protein n=1 Tax=Plutella xylostella TaxID=51655 RepID=A0ABQ7QH56_PLUXY|nr:hypothetical protein JYU34_011748 [Plutella xylostella]
MTLVMYKDNYIDKRLPWYCHKCTTNVPARRRNDATPIRNSFGKQSPISTAVTAGSSASKTSQDANTITFDRFSALLEAKLDQKLDSIRTTITQDITSAVVREMNSAIEKLKIEFTHTTDFLAQEQVDLKKDIKEANARIKAIESENSALKSDLLSSNRRLAALEKTSRSHNLEIHCVPEKRAENLLSQMKNMCDHLGISVSDNEICSVRRVAKMNEASDRPRNILLTLSSERQRDNFISAYRRFNRSNGSNPLNSTHLGIQGDSKQIYLAEHMSPECKELHAATRKKAKSLSYKYVWAKYGRVYVRKNDVTPPLYIKDMDFLNSLV